MESIRSRAEIGRLVLRYKMLKTILFTRASRRRCITLKHPAQLQEILFRQETSLLEFVSAYIVHHRWLEIDEHAFPCTRFREGALSSVRPQRLFSVRPLGSSCAPPIVPSALGTSLQFAAHFPSSQ